MVEYIEYLVERFPHGGQPRVAFRTMRADRALDIQQTDEYASGIPSRVVIRRHTV